MDDWRNISIRLKMPGTGVLSVMAFHEKAGRSQDKSLFILSGKLFSSRLFFLARRVAAVAMLPSALSRSDWFRSVHVGRSRFSRCCHLFGALWFCCFQSRTWARPLTQSPELGFGLLSFLFLERF